MSEITTHDLKDLISANKITVLDIRDRETYSLAHIPNAIHLDLNQAEETLSKLSKNEPLAVCCYHGAAADE